MSVSNPQKSPKPHERTDELAAYFDRLWQSEAAEDIRQVIERVKRPLHDRVHDFVQENRHAIRNLLEVGPGHGWDAEGFLTSGISYTGVDLSLESCRLLNARIGAPMARAQAERLPFASETFDCVYVSTTLMHLEKQAAVSDFIRVLKLGGHLILAEPFGNHPVIRIYQRFKYRDLPHDYMTEDDLKVIQGQMQMLEERYFGLFFISNLRVEMFNRVVQRIDAWLLQFRLFRKFAWMYLGIYRKT